MCCIFRPKFGCCAPQMLVKIVIFSVFSAKKLKKARNLQQIFAKDMFFLSLHPNAGRLFYSPKNELFSPKTCFYLRNVVNHNDFVLNTAQNIQQHCSGKFIVNECYFAPILRTNRATYKFYNADLILAKIWFSYFTKYLFVFNNWSNNIANALWLWLEVNIKLWQWSDWTVIIFIQLIMIVTQSKSKTR